jgi:hypothetical protein
MERLRQALQHLGWPVESLSNQQIARELNHRWFGSNADGPDLEHAASNATANGIFASMAREGNLDALCWSEGDGWVGPEDVAIAEVDVTEEGPERDRAAAEASHPDRRRAPRKPANDFIDFVVPSSSDGSSGWLVDVSMGGIAFVTETKDAPAVGTRIISTIRQRNGETTALGSSTVVRTELLTDSLSLVCAQFEESWEPSQ